MSAPTIVLAVSGHGFGHAVRSAEVARALLQRGARVLVRTDAPAWLFPEGIECLPAPGGWPLDIGVAQHDGLDLDVDETRRRWQTFARDFDALARTEAELLRAHKADIVVGDIPPLAFLAAAKAGVPALAVGNFGWDWIYAAWPDFEDIIATVQAGYASAELLLRLPLHSTDPDAFPAFRSVEDVPLIGRHPRHPRQAVREGLGIRNEARVVLLSFGGFTARGLDIGALGQWTNYLFLLTPPLATGFPSTPDNVMALTQTPRDFVSLLAASDVVLTKPGYGIVVDALANQIAVLYTDRGPFREYDVLAQALPTLGRAAYIPRADLLAGHLGPHLDALLDLSVPNAELRMDGAQVVAERVLQQLASHK
jgi:hypothetical protein